MISVGYDKTCSTCKEIKPISLFWKNIRQPDGLQNVCCTCKTSYNRRYYRKRKDANPDYLWHECERVKQGNFIRKLRSHGVTPEQYHELAKHGCAICYGGPNGRGRFHIDHDHATGKFRGLLCHSCNVGIGSLRDSVTILESAIRYLSTV